jgi:arylsulfatase A-like enzyme
MMIFDTPMLAVDAYDYTRGFAGWDFLRGHHADRYNVSPIPTVLPAAPHKLKNVQATHLYLRNTAFRRSERDWMCAQTFARAIDWLEQNWSRDDFVLWIDTWDPHEPFDAPPYDLARYADPAFDGDRIIYPRYGRPDYMSDGEHGFVRASYAAKVTLLDRWLGRLLDQLETLGLDKNTLILFFTDHGHLFGEHDLQGKPTGPLGQLYEETTRIPLLIRHPDGVGAGARVGGIAQHPDLLPTALEFLGIPIPESVQGRSLWPLIRGEVDHVREFAMSGRYSRGTIRGEILSRRPDAAAFDGTAGLQTAGEPLTLTTRRWAYICPPRGGGAPELYDLEADPRQMTNLVDREAGVAAELHAKLVGLLEGVGTPAERLDLYREPDDSGERAALVPDSLPLYAIEDGRGRVFAFPERAEAESCLVPGLPAQSVRETTFGRLLQEQPRALVHLHEQYYRVEDLA